MPTRISYCFLLLFNNNKIVFHYAISKNASQCHQIDLFFEIVHPAVHLPGIFKKENTDWFIKIVV